MTASDLSAMYYAWTVGGIGIAVVVVGFLIPGAIRAIRDAVRWIRDLDQQLADEAEIRAAELQDEADLATILRIDALGTREPRRTR